ncbi:MAG: excinuclease ABC subunit UvrC, partial [Lentisphaerae bacterium]|nr:excinuclease ABC subunit UvrC [Lentisphaerota bacterium]
DLPDKPGCYLFRDRRGRIIYVGKAASLRKRVQSYFRDATLRSANPKLRGLIRSVADLDFVVVRNEAEAVLTEGRLIKEYKPRYNVSFRDDKRFLLLRADAGQPFPQLKLCRIRRDDEAAYFGPYASAAAARETQDFVEKTFGLRKCSPRIPDGETYRHCINDIVRYCSAPCVGKVDADTYAERFEEACAFLRGKRPAYLKEIEQKMLEASREMDFEKAAALRDTLLSVRAAVKQNARVSSTPEMKRMRAIEGIRELKTVLDLPKIPRTIEAFDVSNISGTYAVASMVCFVDGVPRRNRYRRFRIRTVQGSDDPAMMAEVVRRRFSRVLREGERLPDLVLVDGGLTQLGAASSELCRLGQPDLPVAGLAKKLEELYRGGQRLPVRLPADSPGLQVLQRLRDEAHRFAIAYHLRLRGRRIRESALDEIPGVGPRKKEALLNRFGSVSRLAAATEDELASVAGIGRRLATTILEELGETTHANR